jgi:hypothetical protein
VVVIEERLILFLCQFQKIRIIRIRIGEENADHREQSIPPLQLLSGRLAALGAMEFGTLGDSILGTIRGR